MEYTIKSFFGGYRIYNKQGFLLAVIQKKTHETLRCFDANKQPIATVHRVGQALLTTLNSGQRMECVMHLKTDAKELQSMLRPPMAVSIEFAAQVGVLTLKQNQNRTFSVYRKKEKIGEIVHMFCPHKQLCLVIDNASVQDVMLLFSFGWFMFHQDDIQIV